MSVATKVKTSKTQKTKPKRRYFAFQEGDPVLQLIDQLKANVYKANSDVEIIKIGISKLALEIDSNVRLLNNPQTMTFADKEKHSQLVDKTRKYFKKWYLSQGNSEQDYSSLTDEKIYELVSRF